MAEKIVSPGVFTQEKDLSFVPQGISEIGAAIIGPTEKGPAFIPTQISSFTEFEQIFGGDTRVSYVPYTVKQYLQNAGTVTVVRVMEVAGYATTPVALKLGGAGGVTAAVTMSVSNGAFVNQQQFFITGSDGTVFTFQASDDATPPADQSSINLFYFATGSDAAGSLANLITEVSNVSIQGVGTFTASALVLNLSASSAGTAGNNIGMQSGSDEQASPGVVGSSIGVDGAGATVVSVLHPSKNADAIGGNFTDFALDSAAANKTSTNTQFLLKGTAHTAGEAVTASFTDGDTNNIANLFGNTPDATGKAYLYMNFSQFMKVSASSFNTSSFEKAVAFDIKNGGTDTSPAYNQAATPFITSQHTNGTSTTNLFRVKTRAHGTSTNTDFKIAISNVKFASQVPNSDFGTFTLSVRQFNDTDNSPVVLESFTGLNLNPNSPNFVSRVIGDQNRTIDANGKIFTTGDYTNKSTFIYIDPASGLHDGGLAKGLVPYGFAAVKDPIPSSMGLLPTASVKIEQVDVNGNYNVNAHHGFDYDNIETTNDNINFLLPLDDSSANNGGGAFNLSTCISHGDHATDASSSFSGSSSPIDGRKFIVPFQDGFDGRNPATSINSGHNITGTNTFGFDLSSKTATGHLGYAKALNAISNADEFDINMVVTPGVISRLHSATVQKAIDVCEQRADAFYIMDAAALTGAATIDSIATVTGQADNYDTSYAAIYYPWVKIFDSSLNKHLFVPPSVVLPGVYSFNDSVAAEWFAPAGLNRGGLTTATDVFTRLTHAERDTLYDGRINPIAMFPGQGVTVFGQKTLQVKASALDRVNVRRLLINLKKFIASSARFLVFENNTAATRNRFLSTVNPYLESVQQQQGLFAFRVVMDETNNTPDLIDRNIMKGEIFIQPAKAAEFIVVDFNILPTGASFND